MELKKILISCLLCSFSISLFGGTTEKADKLAKFINNKIDYYEQPYKKYSEEYKTRLKEGEKPEKLEGTKLLVDFNKKKLQYYQKLKDIFKSSLENYTRHRTDFLKHTLEGLEEKHLFTMELPDIFDYARENDPVLKKLIKEIGPLSCRLVWPDENSLKNVETAYTNKMLLTAGEHDLVIAQNKDPGKYAVAQKIRVVSQPSPFNMPEWKSQRLGGSLTIKSGGRLLAYWDNSSPGLDLTKEQANVKAAESLGKNTVYYIMQFLLKETYKDPQKK